MKILVFQARTDEKRFYRGKISEHASDTDIVIIMAATTTALLLV
jgi:hypothetical protein